MKKSDWSSPLEKMKEEVKEEEVEEEETLTHSKKDTCWVKCTS